MFEDLGLEPEDNSAPSSSLINQEDGEELAPPSSSDLCLGHDEIEQKLLHLSESGKLPHAMIFSGPEGIGKATFAYRFIRFLLSNPPVDNTEGDSLFGDDLPPPTKADNMSVNRDSDVFAKVASGGHPDFRVIERRTDEKSGKLKTTLDLEEIKDIPSFLRLTPAEGGWRIVLIDDAETMNRFAQNAILKILEEPPERSILILITRSVGALIPTIRSRSRVFHFAPLSSEYMDDLIGRIQPNLPEQDKKLLMTLSGGQIGLAERYFDSGGLESLSQLLQTLENWPDFNWEEIYKLSDQLGQKGQDGRYECFRDSFLSILRRLIKSKAGHLDQPEMGFETSSLNTIYGGFDLQGLINLHDTIEHHFAEADKTYLDRRQTVLNTFFKLAKVAA